MHTAAADDATKSAQDAHFQTCNRHFLGDTEGDCDDFSTNNDPIFATILPTKPTVHTTTTNTMKPTSSVLYPHLFAKAAYYHTDEFLNLNDMVRFSMKPAITQQIFDDSYYFFSIFH